MARATFVKKARKAVPDAGIEVGDSYYWWKFRHGGKHYSKTAPRPSQLTNSDKLSRAYACAEQLEDLAAGLTADSTPEEIADAMDEIVSEINDIAQEYRDSADNINNAFTGGSQTADDCEEKADSLGEWAQEVEQAADSIRQIEEDELQEPDEDEEEEIEPSTDVMDSISSELDGCTTCPL